MINNCPYYAPTKSLDCGITLCPVLDFTQRTKQNSKKGNYVFLRDGFMGGPMYLYLSKQSNKEIMQQKIIEYFPKAKIQCQNWGFNVFVPNQLQHKLTIANVKGDEYLRLLDEHGLEETWSIINSKVALRTLAK